MDKRFYFFIIIFCVLLLSCSKVSNDLTNTKIYEASNSYYIKAYWILRGKEKFFMGNRLSLDQLDSTFVLNTCGCESKGNWLEIQDTLFLKYKSVSKLHDTLICYQPNFYKKWQSNKLIGHNKGEYIEVLKEQ